jgi:hypothetical protein
MDKSENYAHLLKKYAEFEYNTIDFKTKYSKPENFKNIIENYGLDKLTEKKSFIESMITICQFVYRIVPANKPIVHNPCKYTGLKLLELCGDGHSLNCAGYSILFNEIVLSLGYITKCIFCLPNDLYDDDSHVLCQAYNENTKSWVVIDPAQGCIPCNENGECFNILTLRNMIINNSPLLLMRSQRAYYDNIKIEQYRNYLYKYLFMFMVLEHYGEYYDMTKAHLILPINCNYTVFDIPFKCQITHNSFYLFN